MVLNQSQQENIIAYFRRLQVNNPLTRAQEANLIGPFGGLCVNKSVFQVENMAAVNIVLRPFKGNIKPRDPKGLKLYIQ